MAATKQLTPLNPDVGHAARVPTPEQPHAGRVPTPEQPHASRVRHEQDWQLKESSARLARLPAGLEVPPRLRQRITFDPRQGRLSYYGFMTKSDYDLLRGLNMDLSYQQALEQLFRESSAHSVIVDIGIDRILDDNAAGDPAHPVRSAIRRWVLPWVALIASVAAGGVLVWWLLQRL